MCLLFPIVLLMDAMEESYHFYLIDPEFKRLMFRLFDERV